MRVPVVVAGVEFLAMVDTGATHCILTTEAAKKLPRSVKPVVATETLQLAVEEKAVTATYKINAVEVQLGPARERVSVYIVDRLRYECVVSIGLLRQMGAIIDCRTDTIKWEVRAQRSDKKEQSDDDQSPTMCAIEVSAMAAGELDERQAETLPMSDMEQDVWAGDELEVMDLQAKRSTGQIPAGLVIGDDPSGQLQDLVMEFRDVFYESADQLAVPAKVAAVSFQVLPGTKPVYTPNYGRRYLHEQQFIGGELLEYLFVLSRYST
jgi:predicted aspartyl protease